MYTIPLHLTALAADRERALALVRSATGLPPLAAHSVVLTTDATATAVLRAAGIPPEDARPILATLWPLAPRPAEPRPGSRPPGQDDAGRREQQFVRDLGQRIHVIRHARRLTRPACATAPASRPTSPPPPMIAAAVSVWVCIASCAYYYAGQLEGRLPGNRAHGGDLVALRRDRQLPEHGPGRAGRTRPPDAAPTDRVRASVVARAPRTVLPSSAITRRPSTVAVRVHTNAPTNPSRTTASRPWGPHFAAALVRGPRRALVFHGRVPAPNQPSVGTQGQPRRDRPRAWDGRTGPPTAASSAARARSGSSPNTSHYTSGAMIGGGSTRVTRMGISRRPPPPSASPATTDG